MRPHRAPTVPPPPSPSDPTGTAVPPAWTRAPSLSARELGQAGEQLVAEHLLADGWQVIARNHRVARGEIDIIALDGRTLVFVEVKTRRTLLAGVPQAAVTPQKLRRLRLLAGIFLMEHSPPHRDVRIDVVGVLFTDGGGPEIEHIRAVG